MPQISGQLLWRRMQIYLETGTTAIDTGLCQKSLAFGTDPPMHGELPSMLDPDGTPSRIQVIPMAALPSWTFVTHSEPTVSGGTVRVTFMNSGSPVTINVLFWDPHSMVGPGDADTYNPMPPQ